MPNSRTDTADFPVALKQSRRHVEIYAPFDDESMVRVSEISVEFGPDVLEEYATPDRFAVWDADGKLDPDLWDYDPAAHAIVLERRYDPASYLQAVLEIPTRVYSKHRGTLREYTGHSDE